MITTRIEADGRYYFPYYYNQSGTVRIATRTLDTIAITYIDANDFLFNKYTCAHSFSEYKKFMNSTGLFLESEPGEYHNILFTTAIINLADGSQLEELLGLDLKVSYRKLTVPADKLNHVPVLPESCMNPLIINEGYTEIAGNYKYTLHSGNLNFLGWMVDIIDTDKYNSDDKIKARLHGLNINFINCSFGDIESDILKIDTDARDLEIDGCEFNSRVKALDLTDLRLNNLGYFLHGIFNSSDVNVIISKDEYEYYYEELVRSGWLHHNAINSEIVQLNDKDNVLNTICKRLMLGIKTKNVIFVV